MVIRCVVSENTADNLTLYSIVDKNFVVMDFHWCSEVPGGQDSPIELVRGLEDSRKFLG